jgi:heptosyltransferase-1
MSEILFIKTSSLGDVIHQMPAVTDARRHRPSARISWIVEEAYAPLLRLHPAIDEVIPLALRRWRKSLGQPATWREMGDYVRTLRARPYDDVIDSQGLVRSAVQARLVRGRRHGYDFASARETLAAMAYQQRHRVDPQLHAVARNRLLTGKALGYHPEGAPDYGLDRERIGGIAPERYGVFLHGTARAEKRWPEEHWVKLGRMFAELGVNVVLPWGTIAERQTSDRIAASLPDARVPDWAPLDHMARLIAGASIVIGVDTGLLHLAAALGIPVVAVFVSTNPNLTGPVGAGRIAVVDGRGSAPATETVEAAARSMLEQAAP